MTNTKIVSLGVAVLVVGILLGSFIGMHTGSKQLGAVSYDRLDQVGTFTQGLNQGITMKNGALRMGTSSRSTPVSFYESGTCNLLGNVPILATTTLNVDCAITDILPGDVVKLALQASTSMAAQFVPLTDGQASTTRGFATIPLLNLTGQNRTPSSVPGFGSTTEYQIWRSPAIF